MRGITTLTDKLTDAEQGRLNPVGLNCLRTFPVVGTVGWGARTTDGADILASQWKYIPVRRLALFIEESVFRGTQWAVFEPNDEPLWSQLRLNLGSFMQDLFRKGAFAGTDAAGGLPREVRQGHDDARRRRPRRGERARRVRAAQAGRVRRDPHPAARGPDRILRGRRRWLQFTVNPTRFDPYKNFKFRVKWDGRYVAGVSKVSALKRTTEVVKHRDGGDPSTSRKSPGRTEYEAVTLERGVTHDPEFERWANKVWDVGAGSGAEVSLADFRKDVIVELLNEAGQVVQSYQVFRAWVSEYQALPDLDGNANAVAIQHLKLENEGWERDPAVVEPSEPLLG